MGFNKLDTVLNPATGDDGEKLVTLPCEFDLFSLPVVQQNVGINSFQGASIVLDTSSLRSPYNFGTLRSVCISMSV